jgi:hypothetical protein
VAIAAARVGLLAVRRRAIFVWPNARVHEARRIGLEDAADDHTGDQTRPFGDVCSMSALARFSDSSRSAGLPPPAPAGHGWDGYLYSINARRRARGEQFYTDASWPFS